MKSRSNDQTLAHPWFVGEGLFALATEQTQCLDVVDLLPAHDDTGRVSVTYARADGVVSIAGGSLVFEHPEDLDDLEIAEARDPFSSVPVGERIGRLVWKLDVAVRNAPFHVRQLVDAVRRDARDGRVTVRVIATALTSGVVLAMMASWIA